MTNFFKKLTIVIPTKNRPKWLQRIFIYYSKNNFNGKLLILDSSSKENYQKINILVNSFKKLDTTLRSMPEMNCEQSVNSASNLIDTEYCTFLADDDIILIDGIDKSLEFLELNNNYIGALGKGYMISTFNNSSFGKINSISNYILNGYDNEDPYLRISNFLNNIKNTCFAIFRTNVFVDGYKKIMEIDNYYQSYIFGEIIQSIFYLYNGPIKKIEVDYLVRQYHSENTYLKLDKRTINKKKWEESCELIIKFIESLFETNKKNELKKSITNLFNSYEKKNFGINLKKKISLQFLLKILMIKKIFILFKYILKDYKNLKLMKKNKNINNYLQIIEL